MKLRGMAYTAYELSTTTEIPWYIMTRGEDSNPQVICPPAELARYMGMGFRVLTAWYHGQEYANCYQTKDGLRFVDKKGA